MASMTRSLLKEAKLPAFMWGEAVRHVIYILNRIPTHNLNGKTPYKAWCGNKSNLEHIRVFSRTIFMKNLAVKVKKLDDHGKLIVYLGKKLR